MVKQAKQIKPKYSLRQILFLIFLVHANNIFSQKTVDIVENTLKVNGLNEEVFYYGFSEGDQLIFNYEEVNGKELKEIEIIEMPSSSKFMDYKSKKIENKIIQIFETGVYKFRFSNSSISARICKFKVQRKPANDSLANFNTNVYWRTDYDTVYTPTVEKFLVQSDTTIVECFNSNSQISSQNAINGNRNYLINNFYLPENTVAWSYYIGTGKKSKEAFDKAESNFMQSAAASISKIPSYGTMAALALTGVNYISKVQGEDNVKYWFLKDAESASRFQKGETFYCNKQGDIINEASQMKSPLKGKVYLALKNDNTFDPIHVTIIATAVTVIQKFESRIVQKISIQSQKVPYLKN